MTTTKTRLLTCLAVSLGIFVGAIAGAQTAKPVDPTLTAKNVVKPAAPPVIPDKLLVEFFKAQAEYLGARSIVEGTPQWKTLKEKEDKATQASNAIAKFCGDKFNTQMSKDGDPGCVTKPESPKETKPAEPVKK